MPNVTRFYGSNNMNRLEKILQLPEKFETGLHGCPLVFIGNRDDYEGLPEGPLTASNCTMYDINTGEHRILVFGPDGEFYRLGVLVCDLDIRDEGNTLNRTLEIREHKEYEDLSPPMARLPVFLGCDKSEYPGLPDTMLFLSSRKCHIKGEVYREVFDHRGVVCLTLVNEKDLIPWARPQVSEMQRE